MQNFNLPFEPNGSGRRDNMKQNRIWRQNAFIFSTMLHWKYILFKHSTWIKVSDQMNRANNNKKHWLHLFSIYLSGIVKDFGFFEWMGENLDNVVHRHNRIGQFKCKFCVNIYEKWMKMLYEKCSDYCHFSMIRPSKNKIKWFQNAQVHKC